MWNCVVCGIFIDSAKEIGTICLFIYLNYVILGQTSTNKLPKYTILNVFLLDCSFSVPE